MTSFTSKSLHYIHNDTGLSVAHLTHYQPISGHRQIDSPCPSVEPSITYAILHWSCPSDDPSLALYFFFFCVPAISRVHHFWWDYCVCDFLKSKHRGSHVLSSWTVYAGCVFVAGTHPSRTWISGSFESVRWNACMHRLDLGLHSHLRVLGMESESMLSLREKSPLLEAQN